MKALAAAMMTLTLAGCSAFGIRSGTEEPTYRLLAMEGGVEIREYAPRVVAETLVEGDADDVRNEGFRRLAGYIFGDNRSKSKIAMTAPVSQSDASEKVAMTAPVSQDRDASGLWRIRFFAPSAMTLETMPIPNDARVAVTLAPAQTYAVRRFTGDRSAAAVNAEATQLRQSLPALGWAAEGDVVAWFYDPPWTLSFLRRNEVAVQVRATAKPQG